MDFSEIKSRPIRKRYEGTTMIWASCQDYRNAEGHTVYEGEIWYDYGENEIVYS